MKIQKFDLDGSIIFESDTRSLAEAKQERINIMRSMVATAIVLDNKLDAITQQNAALGIYEPARCEAIKNYISACRNEYLRCKALILAATSNAEADSVSFSAPALPQNWSS